MKLFVLFYFIFAGYISLLICDLLKIKSLVTIQNIVILDDINFPTIELEFYLKNILNKPSYKINFRTINKIVKQHPLIATAFFKKTSFNTLELQIVERRPIALIKHGRFFVVDTTGTIYKTAESLLEFTLPEVSCVSDIRFLLTYEFFAQPHGRIKNVKWHSINQRKIQIAELPGVIVNINKLWSQWYILDAFLLYLHEKLPQLDLIYIDCTEQCTSIMVNFKKGL